ncbi:MAG: simple sugar transport system ATP-binding protein [Candidatus Atribacteria bacterium]|jgi:simple sugar transport system ATP-binding protein|uniref:ATP-binding cassette domain-containing protein n=1 Tax=Thermatribacter velox TaxID=3039681 RepID=A0ABZ2YFS4_9BACT|nr:simple sugar transport system ATP-binding protein [Candidatus Atribacteria bacterium]
MQSNNHLVEMINIHKWFGGVCALKGVDFHVGYREIVGLLGDNGAGKSTLIKILSGFFPPDEGKIFFEGKECHFTSPREARALGIETIYQEAAMVPKMSVMRNIFMGREPIKYKLGTVRLLDIPFMERESMRALEGVDLRLRSPHALVEELSGGQRQGVAIARAMYFKSKLVILDEPTNNLSVKESQRVLEFIKELKNQGISSIFISHNLYHVYPVADRIVVLSHGEKVGDFKKEETSIEEITKLIVLP